jgi:hypothetical protein
MSDAPASPEPESPARRDRPRPHELHVFRDYIATLVQPEFRPIFGSVMVVLFVGTFVFRALEDWSIIDSLYFSVVTLATIGYGDLTPTSDVAKLFSIAYIFVGVGILGVFISAVSRASMQRTLERKERLSSKRTAEREKHLEHDL